MDSDSLFTQCHGDPNVFDLQDCSFYMLQETIDSVDNGVAQLKTLGSGPELINHLAHLYLYYQGKVSCTYLASLPNAAEDKKQSKHSSSHALGTFHPKPL